MDWWTFDNDTLFGNKSTNAIRNNNLTGDLIVNVTGKIKQAVNTTSRKAISTENFYAFGDFSISAWIYKSPTDSVAGDDIVDLREGGTEAGDFTVFNGAYDNQVGLTIQYDGSNYGNYVTTTAIQNNTWTHVVIVKNNTAVRIFINGVNVTTTNFSTLGTPLASTFTPKRITVGSRYGVGTYNFNGLIDELGIWNRTLNSTEISQLYNNGAGLSYDTILYYSVNIYNQEAYIGLPFNIYANITTYNNFSIKNVSLIINNNNTYTPSLYYYNNNNSIYFSEITYNSTSLNYSFIIRFYNDSTLTTFQNYTYNGTISLVSASANFSFYEEITKNAFKTPTYPNISLIISGGSYIYYNTTISSGNVSTGNVLPFGELIIRYSAMNGTSVFLERNYYLTINGTNFNSLTNLYLINNTISQTVRFQIKDVYGTSLNGILVKLMRYYPGTNSYETVEICKTDINGNCYMQVQLATSTNNGEFYKLIFQSGSNVYLESQPSKIYDTVLYYQLQTGESTLADYNSNLHLAYDISFNTATNNFVFTWSNGLGGFVGGCLYVYRTIGLTTSLYNSNCVNSTASTMLINVDNSTTSSYTAKAYAYYGSNPYYLGAYSQSFDNVSQTNNIGKMGLFLAFIVILVFALISLYSAVIGIVLTTVGLIFFTWIGFIAIQWALLIGVVFGAIVVVMVNKRG